MHPLLTSLSSLLLGRPTQLAQHIDVARPAQVASFRRSGPTKPAFNKSKVRAKVKASRKASARTRRAL